MGARLGKERPGSDPVDSLLRPLLAPFRERIDDELHVEPFQRDPETVARLLPLLRLTTGYFSSEVRGWENVPPEGPMLIVGNHSGGAGTGDLAHLLLKWIEERGPGSPLYALAYDLTFTYPVLGPLLRKIGIIPANPKNARAALAASAAVVVFPGGDYEVFRPWSKRNLIEFGGHKGFVKLALSAGVPVVPMTIHGAHQSTIVLTRGHRIARSIGLDKLHVNVFPFIWNIPFGITPAFVPSVQLPAKITVHLDAPFDWSRFGPHGARSKAVVEKCYDEVIGVMQRRLDALAEEHPYPVLTRFNELRPSQILRRAIAAMAPSTRPGGPRRAAAGREPRAGRARNGRPSGRPSGR